MTANPPIACTIEPGAMPLRLAEIEVFGREAFLSAETADATATLRFAPGEENERRLTEIVAAESKCCAFLSFEQRREDDALALRIDAPAGGESMLRALAAALSGYSVTVAA